MITALKKELGEKGFYGIGIYHGKNSINIGTLWRTANIFNASFIFTIGRRYKSQSSEVRLFTFGIHGFKFEKLQRGWHREHEPHIKKTLRQNISSALCCSKSKANMNSKIIHTEIKRSKNATGTDRS